MTRAAFVLSMAIGVLVVLVLLADDHSKQSHSQPTGAEERAPTSSSES